jgi:DNA-binding CsgD family transcriptional regulator
MMPYIEMNLHALKYAEALSGTIEKICEPLFSNFEITNFGYVKMYDDGSMLRLSTDHEWTKKYFMNGFYNDIDFYAMQKVPEGGIHKVLIYGTPIGEHYSALYDHNIWNIIVIYERQKNFGNVWFFAATREKTQIIDFYLNNMHILEHFILYFKEKTFNLIKNKKSERLISTKINAFLEPFNYEKNIKNFLNSMDFDRFYLEGEYKNIYFSKKEFECILHLSHGKTIKEIAKLVASSPKTVETHINNMKKKVSSQTSSKLIDIFQEKYNFYL